MTAAKQKDDAKGTQPQANTEQAEDTRNAPTEDVVAMVSVKADGSPDQTPNFEVIDGTEKDAADDATSE